MEIINNLEEYTSKLFELKDQSPQKHSKTSQKHSEASETSNSVGNEINSLNMLKRLKTAPETERGQGLGAIKLTQQQERFKQEAKAYETYQKNIKEAGEIRTEILRDIGTGGNPYAIILKACKAISLMTGDSLFCEEMERNVIAICGEGFQEKQALEIELEGVQRRIENLEEAMKRPTDEKDLRRIKGALEEHKKQRNNIKKMMAKSKKTH